MDEYENELMNAFNIIWKRKWLIIIPTFFFIIIAGIISFILPPKWEVDCIIAPSKFLIQNENRFEEVPITDPEQIAGKINQWFYNNLIASELKLEITEFPKLIAENLKDADLVRISTEEKDIEKAKLILNSLLDHLKRELDEKADIEINGIDSLIKTKEKEKLILEKRVEASQSKLNIIKQRKQEIEKEIIDIMKINKELEKERSLILNKKNRSESEILTILIHSIQIQQYSMNLNTLIELSNDKTIEEERIKLAIEDKLQQIFQTENYIDKLNERKAIIKYAQITKEPTSSRFPLSPKKTFNILIAGIIGLLIFTFLAFFLDYIEKQRLKLKTEKFDN